MIAQVMAPLHNATHRARGLAMTLFRILPSLRRKIAVAYFGIAFLTLGLSLFAFAELRVLEEKILLGERIAKLFDTAMEIRRFERNYFLHGQSTDFDDNAQYCKQMGELVDGLQADFRDLGMTDVQTNLRGQLATYRSLISRYAAAEASGRRLVEPQVRAAGQRIVASAEDMVGAERQTVRASLVWLRTLLIIVVASVVVVAIAIGQALARRVVQPLQRLERGVSALAGGQRRALAVPGPDREIVAIVSAFNHLLRDLESRQKHLLRSEKLASMGTMVSGVAHELNNPISNIWSSCQLLLEDSALTSEQRQLLQQIDEQCIRARNIVRSLLDFTRERPFGHEPVPLKDLIEQSLRFLKADLPPTLDVRVDIADDLVVPADRQRLQQVMLNLIKNAIEATSATGRIDITGVRHNEAAALDDNPASLGCPDAPWVELSIRDDGHGIPPDILVRIFDPFFTTKDVGKGMGIGLFVVYQIIEEHDGCISASSSPGGGTTFVLRLPARPADMVAP